MADNAKIAADVLAAVGGKENVGSVFHCMTRLRFQLKDRNVVSDDAVKGVKGVMGIQEKGGQYQVIIGTNVPEVYEEIVAAGVNAGGSVDENLDKAPAEKAPLTPKGVCDAVLDYLSGSVVPLIPVLITGGFFKTLATLLGSTMFNVVADDSNFVFVCNMVYNAAFYFIPVVAGFAAAKKLGANPYLGALMGCILIEPNFVTLAGTEGASLDVYGIPAATLTYGQTLIPVLLCVAVMAPLSKFLDKKLPQAIRTVFAPFFTFVIMMPIALCLLAPIGNYIGNGIAVFFEWLAASPFGVLAIMLIAATWPLLVLTGMHVGLAAIALAQYAQIGSDSVVLMAATIQCFTASGVGLAAWLKMRDPEQKNLCLSYFLTQFIGGVGEPLLYGVFLRYKRPWLGALAGGAAAGLYGAITGVKFYANASGLFSFAAFTGGDPSNLVNGCIGIAIGMVVAFIVTWFFGFTDAQLDGKE